MGWKNMIINFIERYFYIICFATYGKDRLEWTRKVDQGQVSKLRAELQGDDYKVKLGGLVSQLYKLACQTYHDSPRGPIKDNLMRKLACKTLMEILPPEVGTKISEEIKEKI